MTLSLILSALSLTKVDEVSGEVRVSLINGEEIIGKVDKSIDTVRTILISVTLSIVKVEEVSDKVRMSLNNRAEISDKVEMWFVLSALSLTKMDEVSDKVRMSLTNGAEINGKLKMLFVSSAETKHKASLFRIAPWPIKKCDETCKTEMRLRIEEEK